MNGLGREVKKISLLVEEVYDLDEFLEVVAEDGRIHHQFYWKAERAIHGMIHTLRAGVKLYGIAKEGHIVVCDLSEVVSWDSPKLEEIARKYGINNLNDEYRYWIKEVHEKMKREVVEKLGSTPGKFEFVVVEGIA
ncbi:hypothetical protein [Archaeoglobus profundus]|uniref:Uncharacterized protein n=1 Tax=Archaeoglobus profundus (strain DSM 5631 / JCM 9629 / NBRC 100127 / Av18) TaxID=572546 RepID=D2RF99_ARCPA|nr:hypothetical protein [Archaeoglobus profundus]ADB58793.1 hypothetical protein Arcpr_1749 [Archaeoglobus profundus DSM 5631]